VEILDTPESFEIKVPIRKYWQEMFVYGGGTILIALIFIMMLFKGILDNSFYFPIEAFGLLFVFLIILNLAMWFNYGHEKLIFTNDQLEIVKSNRIFSIKKTISVHEIESLEIKNEDPDNFFSAWFLGDGKEEIAVGIWWNMGQLTLKTKNSKRTILNGLQESEITKMKTLIEKEIEQRCS
jgi:hypothetical protein